MRPNRHRLLHRDKPGGGMQNKRFVLLSLLLGLAWPALASEPGGRSVEAAVHAGLQWLAERQLADGPEAGSWPTGRPQYRTATTSLAGLAFLANGHFPNRGPYGEVVEQARRQVMNSMDAQGYLGLGDPSGMYIHAIGTLFGLSLLGTLDDPQQERELAEWCQRALRTIIDAQAVRRSPIDQGGWRYTPYSSESDLSVTAWQLLALHAARQAGFEIDPAVFDAGLAYVDRAFVQDEAAGETAPPPWGFVYRPGISRRPEPGVTGVAILVKSLIRGELDDQARLALDYLRGFPPSWGGPQYKGYFYFTLFYISQGMFQIGGQEWRDYADAVAAILLERQTGAGNWPFPPDNAPQSQLTGDAFPTALAILTLSLDLQYLPMFQRQRNLY